MRFFKVLFFFFLISVMACQDKDSGLSPDQEEIIRVFEHSYDVSLEDRNPDSALILARQLISLKDRLRDKEVIFRAYTNAGLAHDHLGQMDTAAWFYHEALMLAYEMGKPEKVAFALQMAGNSLFDQKKFRSAEQKFREALTINTQNKNSGQMAANFAGIGLVRSSIGQPDSATAFYLKAFGIFKAENDFYNQATMLGNIAAQFIEQAMHDMAESYLIKAVQINDSLGNNFALGQNYNSLGTVLADRQNFDSAYLYYQKAIDLANHTQSDFGRVIATFNLAKAKSLAGNYDESSLLLAEVYSFCESNNIGEGQIRSLIQWGENERLLRHFKQSATYLKKALVLNTDKYLDNLRVETLFALSRLALHKSAPSDLDYLDRYKNLNDSISNLKRGENMLDLEAFYQNREKETRIALLKKDNAFQKSRKLIWILIFTVTALFAIGMVYVFRKRQVYLQTEKELAISKLNAQKLQLEKNEKEMELRRQEAEKNKLARQLKEQEIMHQAISYSKLINAFHELREGLGDFKPRLKNKRDGEAFDLILQRIDRANGRNPLNEVITAYNELHPEFYPRLSAQYPELSPRELQICALISLNMSTKEIASLLSISIKSTEIARHRIRKKLRLDTSQNLTTEILGFVS